MLNGEKSRDVAEVLKLTSNMCSDIFCGDWLLFGSEVESEVGVLMNLTTMTMYDGRIRYLVLVCVKLSCGSSRPQLR